MAAAKRTTGKEAAPTGRPTMRIIHGGKAMKRTPRAAEYAETRWRLEALFRREDATAQSARGLILNTLRITMGVM